MSEQPYKRWGAGEPLDHRRLNHLYDRAIFDVHVTPPLTMTRHGNSVSIGLGTLDPVARRGPIWLQLTGESPTLDGHYSWKQMRVVNGLIVDLATIVLVEDFTARASNSGTGCCLPIGTNVQASLVDPDGAGKTSYVFQAPGLMRFGEVTDDWEAGNTTNITPCDANGAPTGAAARDINIFLPTSINPQAVLLLTGNVVGWWPYLDNTTPSGVLNAPPPAEGSCQVP